MTKALKEIIDNSVLYEPNTPLDFIYIINENRLYRGFWGKNGYNKMTFIGYCSKTEKYYHFGLNYERDVLNCLIPVKFNIDIDHKLNCIGISFHNPIMLDSLPLSSFIISKVTKEE